MTRRARLSRWASPASATSRSSPTSITASRRWPTGSSRSPARWTRRRPSTRCSTRWISSASAASRSRRTPCACSTARATATSTRSTSSTRPATSTSPTRSRARSPRARAPSSSSTPRRASRRRRSPTSTSPPTPASRSSPSSTRSTCRRPTSRARATQITETLDLDGDEALAISAKHGTGVPEVLEAIVARIPPPQGDPDAPLKALVFDSFYDSYQGVVVYVRVIDGRVRPGTRILLMSNGRTLRRAAGRRVQPGHAAGRGAVGRAGRLHHRVDQAGRRRQGRRDDHRAAAAHRGALPRLPRRQADGVRRPLPDRGHGVRSAARRAREAAPERPGVHFEPETSLALGYGFRCGFLGMLHMEIVQERLEREFNLSLIVTAPSVQYKVLTTAGEVLDIDNPVEAADAGPDRADGRAVRARPRSTCRRSS